MELISNANNFYELMNKRRTIREFNSKDIPIEVINDCVRAASTAPSGANKQPWFFAVVKSDEMKAVIRKEAEKEEFNFYHKRNNKEWLDDLKKFKTTWQKPHLEEAAALIVIFSKNFDDEAKTKKCYYPKESVGIATGILITAFHRLGISSLTHTPNPMSFLNKILKRPSNEKPFLILAVGYKSENCVLPDIKRKDLNQVSQIY